MKIKLLDVILCRTPAFGLADEIGEKWDSLKYLINEASPAFAEIVERVGVNELKDLNEKAAFTAWKYFNRAKYRATPFGSFAAITTMPHATGESNQPIIERKISAIEFTNWNKKDLLTMDLGKLAVNSQCFQTNSTIYLVGKENRYIRHRNEYFEIASVNNFPELNAILDFCNEKKSAKHVFEFMASEFQMREKDTLNLLTQLLESQLILSDLFPNITGTDYFKRLDIINPSNGNSYIIAERKLISGGFDSRKLRNLPGLIDFLSNYLPGTKNETLNNFKSAFSKKFEQRAIPLTIAMDPETGVGYADLGQSQTDQALEEFIRSAKREEQPNLQINYSPLHRFLLNGIISGGQISLDEFEEPARQSSPPLPNTFSLLLRLWNNQPVIENAGGCTASALLGRFTIANEEVETFGRKIADLEERANPDIVFFDIAYQVEKQVDNVNRRKQLYAHELPILTWSCHPSPMRLDDLLVAVKGGEVILWSKKYNKRAIPRIPSAYNYTRSDLAVYRFLCDLQFQNINADLNFKIRHFFPGLLRYPRVVYKEIVVSPAMWLVPKQFKKAKNLQLKKELTGWLMNEGIFSFFKAGNSDQTLCFDPNNDNDIDQFLLFCANYPDNELYISEALVSKLDGIRDEEGKSYSAEYIVSYAHENPVYKGEQNLAFDKINDMEVPGGDWLYFEIYCHPSRSNEILLNRITLFLKDLTTDLQKWFFIRYDDPAPHIRLRLNLRETSEAYSHISRLKAILEQDYTSGLISDIQVKTYFRETARYGLERMSLAEEFFSADSKYILQLLRKGNGTDHLYKATLAWMQQLVGHCFSNIGDQVIFVQNMADNFSTEMGMGPENFKKLNLSFQQLKKQLPNDDQIVRLRLPGKQENLFLKILSKCDTADERFKITADLIHMHVNRLFFADQRAHEAILYQHLLKTLKTRRALSVAQQGSQQQP
ncbi:lantibiotic dehydratase [Mucilaginibacter sp. BJC16-A38]|uniref:lantibiotic dehydratase n=1 Tax=Mucilaginibacter phenanthrenivorans TaxID=1234842 RepID=UPI002157D0B1|nr:lantibiotic dehydratase [Mucilaginibacter phenanthrenivorans]MCR8556168.1 lantibiotic dehydratase [Mucilaginibacter phenanthrenivorans]